MAAVLQAAPQPDPPAAVSTEKLRLDTKLMQVGADNRCLGCCAGVLLSWLPGQLPALKQESYELGRG